VDARQVSVQYDDVVAVDVQLWRRLRARSRRCRRPSLVSQALGDVVGQSPHVLNDEHPHGKPRSEWGSLACGNLTATRSPPCGRASSSTVRGGRRRWLQRWTVPARPAIGAGSLGAAPPERPLERADLGGVEDRTTVLDEQQGGWALSCGCDLHPTARLVIADGVVEQVDDHGGKGALGCRRPPPRQDCDTGSRWLLRHALLGCRERRR